MKLYTSIDYLPIYNYFEASKGNLKYLYKLKDYDVELKIDEKVLKVYESIEEQFAKLMNDTSAKEMKQKQARIFRLMKQKMDLENCLILLSVRHDDEIAKLVHKLGFTYRAKSDDEKEIRFEDLKRIQGEIQNIKNKIQEIYEGMQEKSKEAEKSNIFDLVVGIQKIVNVPIDVHKVPVSQFISYIKLIKNMN